MHPTRKTILEILKRQGYATVSEIADRLELAPVSVRHHLDLLIGDGVVYTPRVRRTPGAGRPRQVYALTAEADEYFPNNYRQLADDGLAALKQALSPEQLQAVLREMAERTAAQMPAPAEAESDAERLVSVARFLSEQGYMAGFDEEEGDLILHTCNCPYASLVDPHTELCIMDLMLVSELMGQPAERIAHIAKGDNRCSYRFCLDENRPAQTIPLVMPAMPESTTHA